MANNLIKIYLRYTVDSGLNLYIVTMKCYNNCKNVNILIITTGKRSNEITGQMSYKLMFKAF